MTSGISSTAEVRPELIAYLPLRPKYGSIRTLEASLLVRSPSKTYERGVPPSIAMPIIPIKLIEIKQRILGAFTDPSL